MLRAWRYLTNSQSAPRQHGASMVEFALVAPLLFMVVFGTIEIAQAFRNRSLFKDAVRTTARLAATQAEDCQARSLSKLSAMLAPVGLLNDLVSFNGEYLEGPLITDGEDIVRLRVRARLRLPCMACSLFGGGAGLFNVEEEVIAPLEDPEACLPHNAWSYP
jgi:hypothetical protein